jgi:pyrroloquinoline quinone (PQQ) biosynthesis protein C
VPRPRGPLSDAVRSRLAGSSGSVPADLPEDPFGDPFGDDAQLALWMLYEQHYRGFADALDTLEWDPDLLALRARLEAPFEDVLRRLAAPYVTDAVAGTDDLVTQVEAVVEAVEVPSLAAFLQRHATREQVLHFLAERSVYHLKESDPHSFVLPRIDGPAKVALAELLYDEYGAGRPDRLHATLYADALSAAGLDTRHAAYVDQVTAETLAVNNVMSLFGLHRRLRGAALGHLAAFESTSSMPCRRIAAGAERVGLPPAVAAYFDEHVEADAVHEQVAVRDICGTLVEAEPELRQDVLFGVAACLLLDARAAGRMLGDWERDETERAS